MMRTCVLTLTIVLGLLASAPADGQTAGEVAGSKPNIVVILADDMGFGDVQALNPDSTIPTLNIDRLAGEGMTFSDAHSPSAVCTPTRYGLLTGRYCWRGALKRGVLFGYSRRLIEPGRLTVAAMLKQQGYHTAVVGKWHLGMDWARSGPKAEDVDFGKPVTNGPNAVGFDWSFVVPASLDMPPYVYVEDGRVAEAPTARQPAVGFPAYVRAGPRSPSFVMEESLDVLTKKATAHIRTRAKLDQPFFLYFPLTAPHKPVLPHKRFRDSTPLGDYGDFVAQVDWTVGQVLEALDDAEIVDNTLVIFSSDNGSFMFRLEGDDALDHVDDATVQAFRADRHRSNFVFRGTKADVWEGGHHVPFFVRWPAGVPAGTQCDATICLTDVMATCAEVAGARLGSDAAEDSFSLLPTFRGDAQAAPRPPVIHHSVGGMFAIRDGRWKLVAGNGSGGRQAPRGKPFARPYQLFDLAEDIGERRDVLDTHGEVAQRLEATLDRIRSSGRSVSR